MGSKRRKKLLAIWSKVVQCSNKVPRSCKSNKNYFDVPVSKSLLNCVIYLSGTNHELQLSAVHYKALILFSFILTYKSDYHLCYLFKSAYLVNCFSHNQCEIVSTQDKIAPKPNLLLFIY